MIRLAARHLPVPCGTSIAGGRGDARSPPGADGGRRFISAQRNRRSSRRRRDFESELDARPSGAALGRRIRDSGPPERISACREGSGFPDCQGFDASRDAKGADDPDHGSIRAARRIQRQHEVGGRRSPHLDIAAFFVLRARGRHPRNRQRDPVAWLVKKSALRSGHCALVRERLGRELAQLVDLEPLQPFWEGEARQCCLPMTKRPLDSKGPTSGTRHAKAKPRVVGRRLEARCAPGRECRDAHRSRGPKISGHRLGRRPGLPMCPSRYPRRRRTTARARSSREP